MLGSIATSFLSFEDKIWCLATLSLQCPLIWIQLVNTNQLLLYCFQKTTCQCCTKIWVDTDMATEYLAMGPALANITLGKDAQHTPFF